MSGHLLVLGTHAGYDDDDVKSVVIYLTGNILCKSDLTIESDTRIETFAVLAISFFNLACMESFCKHPFSKLFKTILKRRRQVSHDQLKLVSFLACHIFLEENPSLRSYSKDVNDDMD